MTLETSVCVRGGDPAAHGFAWLCSSRAFFSAVSILRAISKAFLKSSAVSESSRRWIWSSLIPHTRRSRIMTSSVPQNPHVCPSKHSSATYVLGNRHSRLPHQCVELVALNNLGRFWIVVVRHELDQARIRLVSQLPWCDHAPEQLVRLGPNNSQKHGFFFRCP